MSDEKALTTGAFGGLGNFTKEALVEIAKQSDGIKGSATGEDIRDAMGNIRPTLDTVKVKGHGANLFLFPDDTKVAGETGLTGVIVAYTRHNSWFGKPFGEQEKGELPQCFSNDGETVSDASASPVASVCSECPRNRDARSRSARDDAFQTLKDSGPVQVCNNYLSIALALPERELPVRVRFTRQSFKAWAAFIQQIGTAGRFLPHEVVTEIKLENVTGGHGEFSVAKFRFVGALPPELREAFEKQRANYRALLQRTAEVDEGEADPGDEAKQALAEARRRAELAEKEQVPF